VETIIITQGEKGALIRTREQEYAIPPAKESRIADPTGVGDAFRSGLITGMMRGYSWPVCGRLGAIAAVYVLEQHGTQRHGYSRQQFADRYRENFGDAPELEDFLSYKKAIS